MYIRRKVFSSYIDKTTGEEKLFSTTELMSEESYLERLYSENELEQKEFNNKAQKALREGVELSKNISNSPYFESSIKRSGLSGKDLIKHVARRDQRNLKTTGTIHDKINDRGTLGWNSKASSRRLIPGNSFKKGKKDSYYDHGVNIKGSDLDFKLIKMGIKK